METIKQPSGTALFSVYDEVDQGIFHVSASFRICYLNPYLSNRLSVDTSLTIGNSVETIVPSGEKVFYEALKRVLNDQQPGTATVSISPVLNYRAILTPVVDGKDVIAMVMLQQEKTPVNWEDYEYINRLVEHSRDFISVLSPEGVMQYHSPSFFNIMGFTPDEIIGKQVKEWLHPNDLPSVSRRFGSTLRYHEPDEKASFTLEFRFQKADGCYVVLESVGTLTKDNRGEACVILNSRDITFRKATEKALQRKESKLRAILENQKSAVCLVDKKLNILDFNHKYTELIKNWFGQQVNVHVNILSTLDSPERMRSWKKMLEKAASGKTIRMVERDKVQKSYFEIGFYPVKQNDRVEGVVTFIRDISKRKRREERLYLMKMAMNNANDGILITDADPMNPANLNVVFVNKAFSEITGYTKDEVLGSSPKILQGEQSDRATIDKIRQAVEDWQPIETDVINYRKDGSSFWMRLMIMPITDEDGVYTHWMSVHRDVTAIKKAEEQDRMNHQFIESLLATTPNLIMVYDQPGYQLMFVNQNVVSILGYAIDEVRGVTLSRLIHPDDQDAFSGIAASLQHQNVVDLELRMKHQNGSWRWLLFRSVPFDKNASGRIQQVITYAQDITRRKEDERALLKSKQQLDSINSHLSYGIFRSIGADGSLIYVNQAMLDLLGYQSQKEMENLSTYKLFAAPNDQHRLGEQLREQGKFTDTIQLRRKDDRTVWAHVSCSKHTDLEDNIIYDGIVREL